MAYNDPKNEEISFAVINGVAGEPQTIHANVNGDKHEIVAYSQMESYRSELNDAPRKISDMMVKAGDENYVPDGAPG